MQDKEKAMKKVGWPFRSLLFVPAHREGWVAKACAVDPDALVLDLEDSVPPAEKAAARPKARASIAYLRTVGVGALVRINPLEEGGVEDVMAIVSEGLHGVCLPKLRDVGQIRRLADLLSYAEGRAGVEHGSVAIVAIPETAEGLCDIRALAAASERVKSFMSAIIDRVDENAVFTGDTALAAGFIPTHEGYEQLYLVSKMCMEARAGGAPYPVATIIGTDISDLDAARKVARRIKAIGFTGGVAIHPSHVAVINELFRPNKGEIEFSVGVLNAMRAGEAEGLHAVRYRGMMIDAANLAIAERTLDEARKYGMPIPDSAPAGKQ
jgi:citrate lyase subunit beta / citryl-CoA lyase